jgi:rod shape-determining protein MreC
MSDIFRNKFFIVFLVTGCILTLITMGLNIAGYGNLVSDAANIIIGPFQTFANMLRNGALGFADYLTKFNEFRDENAVLRERVRELESEIDEAREIRAQNDMLRNFFELKTEREDFRMQDAAVIAGSAANYVSGLTINRGAFHGIELDMPVIAEGGVVGYISEVHIRTSRVSPFIHANNSVGAFIRRTGYTGLVQGDFELERLNLSRMVHLTREADIQEGDRVYSSGYGGIYPEGLFIGTVLEVYSNPLTQTLEAYIEPGVNFNKIRDVMIIREFNWIFD